MIWRESYRADPAARDIADRHYNRQAVGADQFVPPGRCVVLRSNAAVWVTSWPFAQYVKHAWPGAWVNSLFRREGDGTQASDMILQAIAATRAIWEPPDLGMVTFVNPRYVRPTIRRGQAIYGYCYLRAGFRHVGFTGKGFWAWQIQPAAMPAPRPAVGMQLRLM